MARNLTGGIPTLKSVAQQFTKDLFKVDPEVSLASLNDLPRAVLRREAAGLAGAGRPPRRRALRGPGVAQAGGGEHRPRGAGRPGRGQDRVSRGTRPRQPAGPGLPGALRLIQVGVAGYGRTWLDTVAATSRASHVALVDVNPAHLAAARATLGAPDLPAFATLGEALRHVQADAVLCVVPPMHHEAVVAPRARGRPARALREAHRGHPGACHRIVARGRGAAGGLMMVSQKARYHPWVRRFRQARPVGRARRAQPRDLLLQGRAPGVGALPPRDAGPAVRGDEHPPLRPDARAARARSGQRAGPRAGTRPGPVSRATSSARRASASRAASRCSTTPTRSRAAT